MEPAPAPAFDREYYEDNGQAGDRVALWFYERVAARLAPAGSRAIDFGAGVGFFARRLAKHFDASAYDGSAEARELTHSNAPTVHIRDNTDAIEPGSFDLVTALHVLEHIPDPAPTLEMFQRWLAPGGRLLAVVPNPDGWGHRLSHDDWFAYKDPTHRTLLPMHEWLDRITGAGFVIDRAGTDGLWDPPYVKRVPRVVQLPVFGAMAAVQVAVGRLFLPPRWGECLVVIATRR